MYYLVVVPHVQELPTSIVDIVQGRIPTARHAIFRRRWNIFVCVPDCASSAAAVAFYSKSVFWYSYHWPVCSLGVRIFFSFFFFLSFRYFFFLLFLYRSSGHESTRQIGAARNLDQSSGRAITTVVCLKSTTVHLGPPWCTLR